MHASIVHLEMQALTETPAVHACSMQNSKGNATCTDQYQQFKKILIPSDAVKKCTRRGYPTIKPQDITAFRDELNINA